MRAWMGIIAFLVGTATGAWAQSVQPRWIFGMHDPGAESEMEAKGKRGWIVFTEAIGQNPDDHSGRDYQPWSSRGHGVIVRLNNGYEGEGALPYEVQYGNFARRVANFIQNSPGVDIWIIGNETNLPREWPGNQGGDPNTGEAITPQRYVNCFNQIYNELQSRGLGNEMLVPAPTGTWAPPYDGTLSSVPNRGVPGFVDYWVQVLNALGLTKVKGLAIHAYTHGGNGSGPIDPNLVFSEQKMDWPYQNIYYHFRVYRNFMWAIPLGMRSLPVWITEANEFREISGYNWDPTAGTIQWVKNAYAEINTWNSNSANQKIRAVALFRWPDVWEGNRNYCVSCVGAAIEGFRQALNNDYVWTDTAPPSGNDASIDPSQSTVSGSMVAGSAQDVVIRVQNTGGTTWTAGTFHRLGATSSNQFNFEGFPCGGYSFSPANARVALCQNVAPGQWYDFRFRIRAPSVTGLLRFSVQMVQDGKEWFGDTVSWNIDVTLSSPACNRTDFAAPTDRWKLEIWDNPDLSGEPVERRTDFVGPGGFEMNWGSGGPSSCVGVDDFSIRFSRRFYADTAGTYRFTTTTDDGVRLYVDGELIIADGWRDQAPKSYTGTKSLAVGWHDLRMDHYERGGGAYAKILWQNEAPQPPSGSKLGVHVVWGRRDGYGDFLRKITAANRVLSAVHCVDDFGACAEAKNPTAGGDPRTVTVGRVRGKEPIISVQKDPEDNAVEFYAAVRSTWLSNPWIDYWEAQNEIDSDYDWQKLFYLKLMELAEADGLKLALFATATGTPKQPHEDGGVAYAAIKDTCLEAKRGGHIMSMHEYGGLIGSGTLRGTEPYHALRYRVLYDYLRQHDAVVPLVISECAQNAGYQFPGVEIFMEDFMWYDSELKKDNFVIGATIFTLGNWNDGATNFQEALPALGDYIAR